MTAPGSVEQWLQLVKRHEHAARLMENSKLVAAEAYWHAGLAVECALKAYITKKERLNEWPSRQDREELYTHNLRDLLVISGLEIDRRSPMLRLGLSRCNGKDIKVTIPRLCRAK